MDEAQIEFDAAVRTARSAREKYESTGDGGDFRRWRDASEIAIKWHRARRLGSDGPTQFDDDLQELLARNGG